VRHLRSEDGNVVGSEWVPAARIEGIRIVGDMSLAILWDSFDEYGGADRSVRPTFFAYCLVTLPVNSAFAEELPTITLNSPASAAQSWIFAS